jgi:glycosyltransferase involved in cell wall biosynthesis
MHVYADQLRRGLMTLVERSDEVRAFTLPDARLAPAWARYWDQYVRYRAHARACATDVNHIIDHGYGHLAASLPPERTVVTFHDATVLKAPGAHRRTRLALRYSLRAMRRVARVVAVSQSARDDFLELVDYPSDRVTVAYLGIDSAFQPPPDRDALRRRLGFQRPTVLHVGHTQPYMNVTGVLATLALVRRQGVDAALVRVGDALTPAQEAQIDRLGLRDRVTELGRVSFDRLVEIHGAADVLLYPPLYAGFGLPPLEAMACGTPVVCSNRGSLPEVVGDAAPLLDPGDTAGLATAVAERLTDARVRDESRRRGFARARQFSWDITARLVLRVYREIAGA